MVAAVRFGPGRIQAFNAAALSDQQVADITAYVQTLRSPPQPGRFSSHPRSCSPRGWWPLPWGWVARCLPRSGSSVGGADDHSAAVLQPRQAGVHAPHTGVGLVLLGVGSVAAVGAVVAFWLNASAQVFGGLIALSLVAGDAGWRGAHGAMPDNPAVGEREPLASSVEERAAFVESFVAGEQSVGRRRLLAGSLLVLVGALSAVALSMLRLLLKKPAEKGVVQAGWQRVRLGGCGRREQDDKSSMCRIRMLKAAC